ncbi:MAG: hypothetical protein MI810_14490 [Flavobacteriales bacterium]|nr:hypothetical protein [Flavobacteriales bacterium]
MQIEKYSFHCPSCSVCLSKAEVVELNTLRSNGDKGVIRLNISIGNYNYEHEPDVEFDKGEIVDFYCEHCKQAVHSDQYENFALLIMKVDTEIEFEILFSREAGKRKTYIITEDGIESYSQK